MAKILSDREISDLLADPKPLPKGFRKKLKRRPRKNRRHERSARLEVVSAGGLRFRLFVKVNDRLTNNFSVGIVYVASTGEKYNLIRCNGWHNEHINKIEKTVIPEDTCHIHRLREDYQKKERPMAYAEETFAYHDVKSAIKHVARHYGFYREMPPRTDGQRNLFEADPG